MFRRSTSCGCMKASPLAAELKTRPTGKRVLRGTSIARRHSRVSEGLITQQRHNSGVESPLASGRLGGDSSGTSPRTIKEAFWDLDKFTVPVPEQLTAQAQSAQFCLVRMQ